MRRALLIAPVVAVLAACSGSVSIGSSDTLDTAKLETKLEEAATALLPGFAVTNPTCPADVKMVQGGTFSCTVDVAGQPLRFDVTQDDDEGNVSYAKAQAVLDVAKLQLVLVDQIKAQTDLDVTVTCPGDAVLVRDVGATFECAVTRADGATSPAVVTVDDLAGNISFEA
jgi:Domain of unknown function (DUF4333)